MARFESKIVQTQLRKNGEKLDITPSNYYNAYPKTVYEAIHETFDDSSESLVTRLQNIDEALANKQTIIPAREPNIIMTYAGVEGATSGIKITTRIPLNPEDQSNERIPTEKAIGSLVRLLQSSGDGSGVTLADQTVLWDNIINKPDIVNELGYDENALMSQYGITSALSDLQTNLAQVLSNIMDDVIPTSLLQHITDQNNPHGVTLAQLNGLSKDEFRNHVNDHNNPHGITANDLGLGLVNNTSDLDKPISNAVQNELDRLYSTLAAMSGTVGRMNFVSNVTFSPAVGLLNFTYSNGDTAEIPIKVDQLIDDVAYDQESKVLTFTELSGRQINISLVSEEEQNHELNGNSDTIILESTSDGMIAKIKPHSITNQELKNGISGSFLEDNTVSGIKIADGSIGANKYANQSIRGNKLVDHTLTSLQIQDSGINLASIKGAIQPNRVLLTREANGIPSWSLVNTDAIENEAINHLKVAPEAIRSIHIQNEAITSSKIASGSIQHDHIGLGAIESDSFYHTIDLPLNTTKTMNTNPTRSDVANVGYVIDKINTMEVLESQIGDRQVTGSKIFSTPVKNKALVVTETNGDPYWGLIQFGMLSQDSVTGDNVINESIGAGKLSEESVNTGNIQPQAIINRHIENHTIHLNKIVPSLDKHRVLSVADVEDELAYRQVDGEMIADEVILNNHILDRTIHPEKMNPTTSEYPYAVMISNEVETYPRWGRISDNYIDLASISPDKLTRSELGNMVLVVNNDNSSPSYGKITGEMFSRDTRLGSPYIADKAIKENHIDDNAIHINHMAVDSISTDQISDKSITPQKMALPFEDDENNNPVRVIGKTLLIKNETDAAPEWGMITGDLIEHETITGDNIEKSVEQFRVYGVEDNVESPPHYLQLTSDFFVHHSISGMTLEEDITLYGHPKLHTHPDEDSCDDSIPDTKWVSDVIDTRILQAGLNPYSNISVGSGSGGSATLEPNSIDSSHIKSNTITHDHLKENIIGTENLRDFSVTTRKVADKAIDGTKLAENLKLPTNTTITNNYDDINTPRVRNIAMSYENPTLGNHGDIWLQYY